MSKAIAVQAVFLIAVIAIFLFFIAGIFSGWVKITESTVSEASCRAERGSHCNAIRYGLKPDYEWNRECDQYTPQPTINSCCQELKGPKCP